MPRRRLIAVLMSPEGADMENGFLCPWCGELAVRNLNVLPQKMWGTCTQDWSCERCIKPIRRVFKSSRWSPWRKRSEVWTDAQVKEVFGDTLNLD